MKIAGVRFRDNWRVYDFDASDIEISVGDDVIVESDRGLGFARVVRLREGEALPSVPQQPQEQKGREPVRKEPEPTDEEIEIDVETPGDRAAAAAAAAAGAAPAEITEEPAQERSPDRPRPPKGHRKVVRRATPEDRDRSDKNRGREADAMRACQEMIAERELPMKLIRAEYSFDASRVTFYFFSENRVDFRELVKDLAHSLRSRIEMRQVGVRDVARMIGGFGPCGRELCCTSFLRSFEPVSIRMAKKQEMVLNPAKISGICGRLLCCLSYEFKMYDEIKKDLFQMKEAVVREKREAEERKIAEERREAEERKAAEEQRRQEDEQRRQEQKQRDRQRQQEQRARKEEKKKEGPQDQKQRPPQEQRQRDKQQPKQQPKQPQQQQQKRPDQQASPEGQQPQQQGEKGEGRNKRKRRFWRKKKKGGGGQEGGPPSGGGAPPPGGGA
jgi:cell fate regulator YaaT (PSP1 superfamily)